VRALDGRRIAEREHAKHQEKLRELDSEVAKHGDEAALKGSSISRQKLSDAAMYLTQNDDGEES
jgi:hypothetical protein